MGHGGVGIGGGMRHPMIPDSRGVPGLGGESPDVCARPVGLVEQLLNTLDFGMKDLNGAIEVFDQRFGPAMRPLMNSPVAAGQSSPVNEEPSGDLVSRLRILCSEVESSHRRLSAMADRCEL